VLPQLKREFLRLRNLYAGSVPATHLSMFTIFHQPRDLPGVQYAVRRFDVSGHGPAMGPLVGTAETLEEARALVPVEADACMPRDVNDDPVIVETWL
jgi:hypothetical protein